ncbi:MAG: amino acid ABC transporter permease [Alphaproteobacteria bacterium]|nr:amino acid ABC transporter permease [Alphaproteobacteria bacterium]
MQYFFNWDVVWRATDKLAYGLALGLGMAALALVVGSAIGLGCALVLTSPKLKVLHRPVRWYVEIIRNSPLLVLVFFVYFGLPQAGIRTLDNIDSFVLTLTVYAGAYMTEVFRGGLASIPARYVESGMAIGLSGRQCFFFVTLPVMFRIVLPSLSNNLISLFKDTALASAIAVPELTHTARWINVQTFQVVEAWTSVTVLYLAVSYSLAFVLRRIERRYAVIR